MYEQNVSWSCKYGLSPSGRYKEIKIQGKKLSKITMFKLQYFYLKINSRGTLSKSVWVSFCGSKYDKNEYYLTPFWEIIKIVCTGVTFCARLRVEWPLVHR